VSISILKSNRWEGEQGSGVSLVSVITVLPPRIHSELSVTSVLIRFSRQITPISAFVETTYEGTAGFLNRRSQVQVLPGAVHFDAPPCGVNHCFTVFFCMCQNVASVHVLCAKVSTPKHVFATRLVSFWV